MPWILLQAGGKISDFNGGENWASGEQVVASNGKVHSPWLSLCCPNTRSNPAYSSASVCVFKR